MANQHTEQEAFEAILLDTNLSMEQAQAFHDIVPVDIDTLEETTGRDRARVGKVHPTLHLRLPPLASEFFRCDEEEAEEEEEEDPEDDLPELDSDHSSDSLPSDQEDEPPEKGDDGEYNLWWRFHKVVDVAKADVFARTKLQRLCKNRPDYVVDFRDAEDLEAEHLVYRLRRQSDSETIITILPRPVKNQATEDDKKYNVWMRIHTNIEGFYLANKEARETAEQQAKKNEAVLDEKDADAGFFWIVKRDEPETVILSLVVLGTDGNEGWELGGGEVYEPDQDEVMEDYYDNDLYDDN